MPTDSRFDCFETIFGAHYAQQLCRGGYHELWRAIEQSDHPLMQDMAPAQRTRLRAVLRLCQLYYCEQKWTPERIDSTADVVRRIRPRTRAQQDRIVWLLAIDGSGCLQDEVLVQMGGHPTEPPPTSSLLRHALFKQAARVVIADYQLAGQVEITKERVTWLSRLVAAFALVSIELSEYIILTPNVVVPLRERICALAGPGKEEPRRAA